jgi:hypothetical protein
MKSLRFYNIKSCLNPHYLIFMGTRILLNLNFYSLGKIPVDESCRHVDVDPTGSLVVSLLGGICPPTPGFRESWSPPPASGDWRLLL